MAAPLVSIITVVLNAKELLEKTITSVLEQTYPSVEYIIIDGGSLDGSVDIIKKYTPRLKTYLSEPDQGLYDAMNKGLDRASGEWVYFLNAGDTFYSPDVLKQIFSDPNSLRADIIYGDTLLTNIDNEPDRVSKALELKKYLWRHMCFYHQAMLVRSELLKIKKFNTAYRICADYDFVLGQYVRNKKFYYANKTIATYRLGGFSNQKRLLNAWEHWKIAASYNKSPGVQVYHFIDLIKTIFLQTGISLKRMISK